jgi:hypothetical protein
MSSSQSWSASHSGLQRLQEAELELITNQHVFLVGFAGLVLAYMCDSWCGHRRYQAELAAAVARAQEAEVELHMLQQRVSGVGSIGQQRVSRVVVVVQASAGSLGAAAVQQQQQQHKGCFCHAADRRISLGLTAVINGLT